jgi:hypothetical protein
MLCEGPPHFTTQGIYCTNAPSRGLVHTVFELKYYVKIKTYPHWDTGAPEVETRNESYF